MKKILLIFIFLIYSQSNGYCVLFTSVTSGSSTSDATNYNTSSVTPTGGRLQLLAVMSRVGSGSPNTPTVTTSDGITWTAVTSSVAFGTGMGITLLKGTGASPTTAVRNIDFAGQTQTEIAWSWVEASPVISGSEVVQSNTSSGSGTSSSVSLNAFGNVNNYAYICTGKDGSGGWNSSESFVALHAVPLFENSANLGSWDKINDNSATSSWTGTLNYASIAVEVSQVLTTIDAGTIDASTLS